MLISRHRTYFWAWDGPRLPGSLWPTETWSSQESRQKGIAGEAGWSPSIYHGLLAKKRERKFSYLFKERRPYPGEETQPIDGDHSSSSLFCFRKEKLSVLDKENKHQCGRPLTNCRKTELEKPSQSFHCKLPLLSASIFSLFFSFLNLLFCVAN